MAATYSCLNDCIYEREGRPGAQYCFARGDLQVWPLSNWLSVRPTVRLFVQPSICPSIVNLFILLFICLSSCPSVCLAVHRSV